MIPLCRPPKRRMPVSQQATFGRCPPPPSVGPSGRPPAAPTPPVAPPPSMDLGPSQHTTTVNTARFPKTGVFKQPERILPGRQNLRDKRGMRIRILRFDGSRLAPRGQMGWGLVKAVGWHPFKLLGKDTLGLKKFLLPNSPAPERVCRLCELARLTWVRFPVLD